MKGNLRVITKGGPIPVAERSTAARLLGLPVRVPVGTGMSASCECCQVETSASDLQIVQRGPTACGVSWM